MAIIEYWRWDQLNLNNEKTLDNIENLQGKFQQIKLEILLILNELEKRQFSK